MRLRTYRSIAALSTSIILALIQMPPAQEVSATEPPDERASQVRVDQWHLRYLSLEEVHRISQGKDVIVAVPDTGVAPHPDLRNNLLPGTDVLPSGNGDGRLDRDGHGTAMAGLIAGHGQRGNPTSTLGIAPKASILPIFSTPSDRKGTPDALAEGIIFAVNKGVDVISISSVGGSSPRLVRAIEAAITANIVVVASAGNMPRYANVGYPASHPGVIAVGGVDRDGNHAAVSVTGPQVSIVAPATDLYSTNFDGGYRIGTGTSGAAAIVAGAAALVRSKYPYLTADEVAHRLTATAVDKGPPGRDDQYGYGVIDLVAALTADVPPRGFESVPTAVPDDGGSGTAAEGPQGGGGGAATVRGLVTAGVLLAVGGAWAWLARRRRRGGEPPPRITR